MAVGMSTSILVSVAFCFPAWPRQAPSNIIPASKRSLDITFLTVKSLLCRYLHSHSGSFIGCMLGISPFVT